MKMFSTTCKGFPNIFEDFDRFPEMFFYLYDKLKKTAQWLEDTVNYIIDF